MNEIDELKNQVHRLRIGVWLLTIVLLVFICVAAAGPSTDPLRTTSLVIVDATGKELAHWDSAGVQTNTLKVSDSGVTTALLSKDGLKVNRMAIADSDGHERARWDTDKDGQPRLGLEDSGQSVRIAMSVMNDNPTFTISGSSKVPGFALQMVGDIPAMTLQDPVTSARFGRIYTDQNGNQRGSPVGRLTLSIRDKPYWSNPVPKNASLQ
jgi:hypothetical protein